MRLTGKLLAVAAVAALTLQSSGVGNASTAPAATPNAASAALGFTVGTGGWVDFTNTLTGTSDLQGAETTTDSGTIGSDGTCTFAPPATTVSGADSGSGYSEETAVNTTTCQETVVSGTLTATGVAQLNAQTASDSTGAVASDSSAAPSSQIAAATSNNKAFEKASYVDPADITITSLTDNLTWSANGRIITKGSAYSESYKFPLDNWSDSKVSFAWTGCIGCAYLQNRATQTFYNTDFELVIVAILGPAGYALCGFNSNPATFHLSPYTRGGNNGSYLVGHSNSVHGGCSDLVHFRENHGRGHSS